MGGADVSAEQSTEGPQNEEEIIEYACKSFKGNAYSQITSQWGVCLFQEEMKKKITTNVIKGGAKVEMNKLKHPSFLCVVIRVKFLTVVFAWLLVQIWTNIKDEVHDYKKKNAWEILR